LLAAAYTISLCSLSANLRLFSQSTHTHARADSRTHYAHAINTTARPRHALDTRMVEVRDVAHLDGDVPTRWVERVLCAHNHSERTTTDLLDVTVS
jgi:hypothetical protein